LKVIKQNNKGVYPIAILLANYFFMSGAPILAVSNLQNSISFDKGMTKLQGIQEYFANSIYELRSPARMKNKVDPGCGGVFSSQYQDTFTPNRGIIANNALEWEYWIYSQRRLPNMLTCVKVVV
jgi:hypothetical protein